jgi:hypothetical protein
MPWSLKPPWWWWLLKLDRQLTREEYNELHVETFGRPAPLPIKKLSRWTYALWSVCRFLYRHRFCVFLLGAFPLRPGELPRSDAMAVPCRLELVVWLAVTELMRIQDQDEGGGMIFKTRWRRRAPSTPVHPTS